MAGLERLLVLLGEDAGAAAGADERADGVEGVGHREREDRHEHKRELGRVGEQGREALGGEDRAEGLRQLREGVGDRHGIGHRGHAERDADHGGDGDGQQQAALDLEHGEGDGEHEADEEHPQHRVVEGGQARGGADGGGGLGVRGEGDEVHVQHADIGHEQADAAADRVLEHRRDGLDDHLANLGDRDDDVDDAAQEHHAQRLLPGEPEAEAHGVGEERVQTHAGGLRIRHIGEQAHDQGARDGRDDGGEEHAAPRHAGLAQDLGVDDDDVRHREERGQAGQDLGRDRRAVLLQMEELLHYALFFLFSWI